MQRQLIEACEWCCMILTPVVAIEQTHCTTNLSFAESKHGSALIYVNPPFYIREGFNVMIVSSVACLEFRSWWEIHASVDKLTSSEYPWRGMNWQWVQVSNLQSNIIQIHAFSAQKGSYFIQLSCQHHHVYEEISSSAPFRATHTHTDELMVDWMTCINVDNCRDTEYSNRDNAITYR